MTHSAKTQTPGQQEAAAWRKLAQEIDASPNRITVFLCLCVNGAEALHYPHSKISAPASHLRDSMLDRIRSHDWEGGFKIPKAWGTVEGSERNNVRVLACLWLALEAEEEG